jgi:hypothetical protein
LHWITLFSSIVAVNKPTLYLADDLPEDVSQNPDPDGLHGGFGHAGGVELLELLELLSLVLVSQDKKDNGEGDHDSIND